MIDCASPPPIATAKKWRERGFEVLNVYVGGPGATEIWPDDTTPFRDLGFRLTATYVPEQGARLLPAGGDAAGDALACLEAHGMAGCPLFGDVEEASYEANTDGARTWARTFVGRLAGHHRGPYGPPAMLGQLGDLEHDARATIWAASWLEDSGILPPAQTSTARIPGLSDGLFRGRRAWQYAGDIDLDGHLVDLSVIDATVFAAAPVSDRTRLRDLLDDLTAAHQRVTFGIAPACQEALADLTRAIDATRALIAAE
jgi:hypothetical protein